MAKSPAPPAVPLSNRERPADLKAFTDLNRSAMAKDRDGNPVFLAKSAWEVGYIADRYAKVRFDASRER